uniref:Uncharacterized protein n=1 Tax=Fagus sylvatica TaxID=28930 RepID=A0A2N9FJX8_FAGSY
MGHGFCVNSCMIGIRPCIVDLMFWVWNCDGVAGFFMNPCAVWVVG